MNKIKTDSKKEIITKKLEDKFGKVELFSTKRSPQWIFYKKGIKVSLIICETFRLDKNENIEPVKAFEVYSYEILFGDIERFEYLEDAIEFIKEVNNGN